MNRQIFTIAGINPEPWAIGSLGIRRGVKPVPFIGPHPQLVTYKEALKIEIARRGPAFVEEPCSLKFLFWRRLDKYVTISDKGHQRHIADATNLQKAAEDALQGIALSNDRLVQRITSMVVEQAIDTDPGLIIVMKWPFDPHDEFEIQQDILDEFAATRKAAACSYMNLGNTL